MKKILILTFALVFSVGLSATDRDSLWNGAVEAYTSEDYPKALTLFEELSDEGYLTPQLYYNIANCYFKQSGYIAQAILYYEKAIKFDPSYEDAHNNLALARQFTLDRIDEVPEFVLITWTKSVRNLLSSSGWGYLGIGFFALVALLMLLFRYGRTLAWRKTAFALAIVSFLFFALSIAFSITIDLHQQRENTAIVMTPVASIKSSPTDSGKSLFILHEGTKIEIIETLGEWRRVELSDGRQGWMMAKEMEII